MLTAFIQLLVAIGCEVVATTALRASEGFTRLVPVIIVFVGYTSSFYFMSRSLRFIPLGVAYATWSGVGTVGIVAIGALVWHEQLTLLRLLGILLIIIGVVLVSPHSAGAA